MKKDNEYRCRGKNKKPPTHHAPAAVKDINYCFMSNTRI